MDFLKAEQLKTNKWRVLAIPFGGPKNGKDLDDEFFSPRTDIKPDWFDRRPLVWHHNLDRLMRDKLDPNKDADSVLGTADDLELDEDKGWWTTIWLDRSHQYWEEVNGLLSKGKIYGSSGSLPNFVRVDRKTGEIITWPYIEQTLTPTPANFYSVVQPVKAVRHFEQADIGLHPALRGILSDLDSQPADLGADLPDASASVGEDPAIQRPTSDPRTDRAKRMLVDLAPRLVDLTK